MPRIRTIKPEFWGDEKLSTLDTRTRLVFLGLISFADDRGRLVDNIKTLDGQIFPSTDDSCAESLECLSKLGRVQRYSGPSGQNLIQIANWKRHQKVDKPSKYSLPPPPGESEEYSGDPREDVATDSREARAPILDRGSRTSDRRPPDRRGEGMLIFTELRSQRIETRTAMAEVRYNIPKSFVASVGRPAQLALEVIGGAYALANADGDRLSVLRGQFATAYAAAIEAGRVRDAAAAALDAVKTPGNNGTQV